MQQGTLEKFRLFLLIVAAAVLPGGNGIAGMALALEHRNGRVGDGEHLAAAVGLFDGYLQVPAVACGVEIVDGKRAGRHRALVDLIAVLFDRYLGRAAGNPVNDRGEPLLAVRQHIVVGSELRAAEVNAVKDVAVGVAVAQREARTQ
ncbi:Secreted protein [Klebsiella michiganensis]